MTECSGNEYTRLLVELSATIADRTYEASSDSIALRDAVCAYVVVENARGTPLTVVIEAVRLLLRKAEKETATASPELARKLVDWCREFHPDEAGDEPPHLKLVS